MTANSNRPENTVKCWCNRCHLNTMHSIQAKHTVQIPGMVVHGNEMRCHEYYMVVQCRGCEEIHFLKVTIGDEDVVWAMGYERPFDSPTFQDSYPPRNKVRSPPKWLKLLEPDLRDLLEQTYVALHTDAYRLVVMGTRAALERTIVDKCSDQGSFVKNVSKFVEEGYLAQANSEAVTAALDVGSAAIHRSYEPDLEAILDVLEIVESVIHAVYVVPESGIRRRKLTPKRTLES